MTWQRKHQRRMDRANRRLNQEITRATDDLTISDAERHRRLEEAGRRRARAGAKAIRDSQRRVNQDGCAVTALLVGTAALGALAAWKGVR